MTNHFQYQNTPLTYADLDAWYYCVNNTKSIGFYNSDGTAGASQTHKHMQIIPLCNIFASTCVQSGTTLSSTVSTVRIAQQQSPLLSSGINDGYHNSIPATIQQRIASRKFKSFRPLAPPAGTAPPPVISPASDRSKDAEETNVIVYDLAEVCLTT